jgi:hypothetical protein
MVFLATKQDDVQILRDGGWWSNTNVHLIGPIIFKMGQSIGRQHPVVNTTIACNRIITA